MTAPAFVMVPLYAVESLRRAVHDTHRTTGNTQIAALQFLDVVDRAIVMTPVPRGGDQ